MNQPITFNGKELPEFIKVTGIELPVTSDLSPMTEQVPKMFGLLNTGTQIKGGTFKFTFVVVLEGLNIMEARDQFEEWLRGDAYDESQLIFKEQPDRYYMARVSGATDIKDMFLYGQGSFQMVCSKVRKYSIIKTYENGNNPLAFNYSGTFPTMGIVSFKLNHDYKDMLFTHKESGKSVFFVGTFKAGDELTIDFGKKVCKLNGQVNMRIIDFRSEWATILKGNNTFGLYVGGTLIQSVVLSMVYQRKWY